MLLQASSDLNFEAFARFASMPPVQFEQCIRMGEQVLEQERQLVHSQEVEAAREEKTDAAEVKKLWLKVMNRVV